MPSPTNQSLEGENLSNPQQSEQVSTKFFYMALMMCVCASLWILYICHKVNQEFVTFFANFTKIQPIVNPHFLAKTWKKLMF